MCMCPWVSQSLPSLLSISSHHSSHKTDQNLSSLPTPGSPRKAQDRMYRHWPFTETNKRIFYCEYFTFTGCKCLDSWYCSRKSEILYLSGELFCTWSTQDQASVLSLARGGSPWSGTTCKSPWFGHLCHHHNHHQSTHDHHRDNLDYHCHDHN